MEILGRLGVEPGMLAAQIINFLILFVIFRAFLYKPIMKILNERKARIARGIEDAEAASKALYTAKLERDAIINKASGEAEKIIEESRQLAASLRSQLLNESSREAERIVKEAEERAAIELEKARLDAQEMTVELAKQILDRVLSELFTETDKEKILARNITKLTEYDYHKRM